MRFANEDGGEKVYPEADMCAVFLGVYSMQHGATVPEHDIGILRSALKRADLPQEVKEQVEKALTHYKNNGDGWNFKNTSTGELCCSSYLGDKC